jgi:hypothetical protein
MRLDLKHRYGGVGKICSRTYLYGVEKIGLTKLLVGAGRQARRHVKAERPRGLRIDHQFVFGWRLLMFPSLATGLAPPGSAICKNTIGSASAHPLRQG